MTNRWLWAAMLLVGAAGAPALAQVVPTISAETAAATALTAAQQQEVDAFVRHYAQRMVAEPTDAKAVQDARKKLEDAYAAEAASAPFKSYFASSAVNSLAPAVQNAGSAYVQLNAALTIAGLRDAAELRALSQMASHANPAVRYVAVKAYRDLRPVILGGPPADRNAMIQTLAARGQAEASPAILALIFQTLNFSPAGDLAGVNTVALSAAQGSVRQVIGGIARAHLQGVRDARPSLVSAYVEAVRAVESAYSASGAPAKDGLVLLSEIIANGGAAYLDRWQAYNAIGGRDSAWQPANLNLLLRGGEAALNRMTQREVSEVAAALIKPVGERGPAVKLAVNQWVGTPETPGILNGSPWDLRPPTELAPTPAP